MIFSELYSAYYHTVAEILKAILSGTPDEKELKQIVSAYAFGDSMLSILPALKEEKWQLVGRDLTTPIRHVPTMPLTTLEKKWLKAISLDPRIRLFDIAFPGLEAVEPLFTPQDYQLYDRYSNGDPFENEGYIRRFRLMAEAIGAQRPLMITFEDRHGRQNRVRLMPRRLEYSEKDDKFRLIVTGCKYPQFNLGKIRACSYCDGGGMRPTVPRPDPLRQVTFLLEDERNALERAMLHFAHFEKQTERTGEHTYRITLTYRQSDETEMVIRILSFGPFIRVTEPASFVQLITERLQQQKICGLF